MIISPLLRTHMRPLLPYFDRNDVIEICINEPGKVWLETVQGWEEIEDTAITKQGIESFASMLATTADQKFNDSVPILSTSLPEYGFRVQIVGGALVESGISMSIRVGTSTLYPIESYMPDEQAADLTNAITQGRTVLVSGGTSSGKTTFMNALIQFIPPEARIIAIEDTKELIIRQKNSVRILKSKTGTDIAKITYKDIINSCMRMRPDRILLGELDIENTIPFLRLLNTGHAGCMATVHADGPQEAIDAIILNAKLAGLQGNESVKEYARKCLDIVVQIQKQDRKKFTAHVEYI